MKNTVKTKKINITMREDILEQIDNFATFNGMSRSGLITSAVVNYIQAKEVMPSYNKLLNALSSVVDATLKEELTEEEANKRIQDIKSSYDLLSSETIKL